MAKSEMWRDYAAQAQVIADLRTDLKSSNAQCARLLEMCHKFRAINDEMLATHNKLRVQFDRLMESQQNSIDHINTDAAAFTSIADRFKTEIAAREAEDAAKEAAEKKPAA
jgi:septal ring factor EnvC (AmiA/AmiB activator)